MELIELEVRSRDEKGSSAASRLRRAGNIPAVVYSEGSDAQILTVDAHSYSRRIEGKGASQLFRFKSDTPQLDGLMTLVKSVQRDPIKGSVLHVDFLSVHEGHRITVTIPIEVIGEPVAVKHGESLLNQTLYEVDIECLPTAIPEFISVDVSAMNEGDAIHLSDIALPAGVELVSDPELAVLSVIAKRMEEEAVAAPTAVEGAAPEAAAAEAPAASEKETKPAKEKE